MIALDRECRPLWANRAARVIAGCDGGEAAARTLLDVPPAAPDDMAPDLALVCARALAGEGVGSVGRAANVRLGTAGGVIQRDLWVATVPGSGGAPESAVVLISAEEERLQALLEHTADVITVLEPDGSIRYSNPAAGEITGYQGRVLAGSSAFDLLHPDDRDEAVRLFGAALEHQATVGPVELRMRHGDGSWRSMAAYVNNLVDHPAVGGVVVTLHDVTDRKAAEEHLARSEAHLRALVENLSDVIVVLDRNARVTYASPAIEQIIGQSVEEAVGGSAFADIHDDDLDAVRAMVDELIAEPGGRRRFEMRLRNSRTQEFRWVDVIAANRLDDPVTAGIVATVRDVSDIKQVELALQAAYEREKEAADRLREVDQLKDEFLATVSHELRTPLTSIAGFARLLGTDGIDEEQRRVLLERVVVNADEMVSMVEQLLDYSRLQAGKAHIDPQPTNLAEAVRAPVAHLSDRLSSHEVVLDVPADLTAFADEDAVSHVLRNLLTNAAKFAPASTTITVAAEAVGDEVHVRVIDEGPGIAPAEQHAIFDRFHQVPGTGGGVRGTGLGLSIARRYTEMQGGRIWVESEPGHGATFTFTLPGSEAGAS